MMETFLDPSEPKMTEINGGISRGQDDINTNSN